MHQKPKDFWANFKTKPDDIPEALLQVQKWENFILGLAGVPPERVFPLAPLDHAYPQRPCEPATHLNEPFTLEEVLLALNRSKPGKAKGLRGMPMEFFSYAKLPTVERESHINLLAPVLRAAFNSAFSRGLFPSSLNESLITPVFKKGDPVDSANY